MTSLHPATFAKRYVDLRKAMEDGVVTKREVTKLIQPHYRDTWTDQGYFKVLTELSVGSSKTGLGTVRATKDAQASLRGMLAWEGVGPLAR